ncbi:MAG: serine hydrolase [Bacteroidia bacterium]|nr:serine hydrolase [Bacteroidia bacterium]
MRRKIQTLIFILFSLTSVIYAQDKGNVSFYAKGDYTPITDMSHIEVAISSTLDALPLMRRYYDGVYEAHPSILTNRSMPSHYVVITNEWQMAKRLFEGVYRYYASHGKRDTKIVLLYGGELDIHADSVARVLKLCDALYLTPQDDRDGIDLLVQSFWGGRAIESKSDEYTQYGLKRSSQEKSRLSFHIGTNLVVDSLNSCIDKIAQEALDIKATPGLSVIIAQHGEVLVNKQYGYTTYQETNAVSPTTIYDIASLSKIVGTLPQVILLFDQEELNAKETLSSLLGIEGWQGKINVGQLLLHTSGLPAGIPAYALTVDSASFQPPLLVRKRDAMHQQRIGKNLYLNLKVKLRPGWFVEESDAEHPIRVSRSLYASDSIKSIMWRHIANIPQQTPTYRYSDINFLYLQRIIERKRGKRLDELFDATIAAPLGLKRMLYNPTNKYRISEIAPTSDDLYFRKEMIWTTVHDETAALMGGVSGNAGLFATAYEVAKIGQLYLNGGTYGGVRLFKQETFDEFIMRHDPHCRRGYGFDMPERRNGKTGPVPDCMPKTSYGHTGFTGTMMWIDPESETLFVFMSNRIHPSVDNTKLTQKDIRSKMLEAISRFLHP